MSKKILLLFAMLLMGIAALKAQSLTAVGHPAGGTGYGSNSSNPQKPFTFNGKAYLWYLNSSNLYQLAEWNGTALTLISHPSGGISLTNSFSITAVEFGGNMYLGYTNASGNVQLAKFNGTSITLINNANTSDLGYQGHPFVYNNELFFMYINSNNKVQLAKYSGSGASLTLINNVNAVDQGYQGYPIVFNNELHFRYATINSKYQLAKYNNSNNTITLIPNPIATGSGHSGDPIVFNGALYFQFHTGGNIFKLAKYNGSSVTLIDNANSGHLGYQGDPIVFNNELYLNYQGDGNFLQVAKYSGTGSSLTLINNVNATDYGYLGSPIIFNNELYIHYSGNNNRQHLAKCNGSSLTLINNANTTDPGNQGFPFILNNELYIRYSNSNSKAQLAKYSGSGSSLAYISNPSISDPGIQFGFKMHNGAVYFQYRNTSNKFQLAKFDGSSVALFNNPDAGDGYYDSPIGLNSQMLIRYLNASSEYQLAYLCIGVVSSTINTSICAGSSYTFNGVAITTPGTYLDTFVNACGNDSIVTLNLSVSPTVAASIATTKPTRCNLNGSIALSAISTYNTLTTNNFSGAIASPFSTTGSAIINNGELQLTSATNSLNGAFIYTPTSTPSGFTALFDLNIYNSPSGNEVADGISFNYGNLQASPIGHEDGMLNGNGLVIRFKEWQTQRVDVVYNGVVKGTYNVDLHNPKIRKVRIAVLPTGKLDLSIGDQVLCNNLDLGVAYSTDNKTSWKFAWGSRTGGSNNRHAIDNIEIYSNENGIAFTHDNWTSQRALPFFDVVPNTYTILGGNATCSSTIGTATVTAFNTSNVTTVSNTNNPTCTGRTITVTNTLVNDTLVWSDFASRPTLSNFGNLGNATFSNGSVQLTDNTGSQNGRIVFPQTPNAGVFTATFKARVWDGNNADGFSFNYGQIDNVWGAEAGMMNTNTPGLSVGFPTWNTNNIVVKYKNNVLTTVPNTGSGGNRASFFTPIEVSVNAQYQLTVKWNGTTYINNYDLAANSTYETDAKTNWQFGWGARTGGQIDRHQLDDILVVGKPGLLYSYDGGTTFETNATKTINNTNAVSVVVKADGICSGNTVSFPAITTTTPTFAQVAPICAGSTLAALPTTSNNGIAGNWLPSINNLATTTYTFTPTNTCNPTTTMTIVVNPMPIITSVSATPNTICAGDSSKLIVGATLAGTFVSTLAGSSTQGSSDGSVSSATFNFPHGVATDIMGNIYVADRNNHKIRKITPSGLVSTFAGSGIAGSADGSGTSASFKFPTSLATDAAGNVYVADRDNHKIRKITPAGVVTTLAGSGALGSIDANGIAATFTSPSGVAIDVSGNLYVADAGNNKIRKITPAGAVTTLAGSGIFGSANGTGTAASFSSPRGITVDFAGNVYVADYFNHQIRKINTSGVVTIFAGSSSGSQGGADGLGTSASFALPIGLATDIAGNIYVVDNANNKIRKITPSGAVTTIAGQGGQGSTDGIGTLAKFTEPYGVATDNVGNVYVADQGNHKIRKITQTAPQTYSWSNTVNSLSAALDTVSVMPIATTIYTVTASTTAGCTTTSTVTVTVKPNYTINASAGANGNMSPTGNSAMCEGSNLTYTITPNANYQIADVLVDGISVGAVTSYTFNNVTAPHTISASFVLICVPTSNATSATSCYTYTWSVNNVTYNASGTYTAIMGCHTDSLILTIQACKDVKCFLQGYYTSAGIMQPVLLNQGVSAPATACDTIDVWLHSTVSPYDEVYSFKGVLSTAGLISCVYPEAAIGNSYYMVVKHRNSIDTWSADPILITNSAVYDFTTASNKAYASNMTEVEPGVFAMYMGDLNHDGYVDGFDFSIYDADAQNNVAGMYVITDLNGDGFVDVFDYSILDLSTQANASIITP